MASRATTPALHRLPARVPGGVNVVVECPRGAAVKWKFDPALGAFGISRPLPKGLTYPYDWGFLPGTRAPDGDPLDALVLWEHAGFPGLVLPCRVIGALKAEQNGKRGGRQRNDRLMVVPLASADLADLKRMSDLPSRIRAELEAFFLQAVRFEDKALAFLGWTDAPEANALVERAIRAARKK